MMPSASCDDVNLMSPGQAASSIASRSAAQSSVCACMPRHHCLAVERDPHCRRAQAAPLASNGLQQPPSPDDCSAAPCSPTPPGQQHGDSYACNERGEKPRPRPLPPGSAYQSTPPTKMAAPPHPSPVSSSPQLSGPGGLAVPRWPHLPPPPRESLLPPWVALSPCPFQGGHASPQPGFPPATLAEEAPPLPPDPAPQ